MKYMFTISILALNKLEITKQCLNFILRQNYNFPVQLILTNNGSTDDTLEYFKLVKKKFDKENFIVNIIDNEKNIGYIDGNKKALFFAEGEYFLTLNNDTKVSDGWLDQILETFNLDNQIRLVGPILRSLTNNGNGYGIGNEYIEGCCMCILTSFARQIGLYSDYLDFAYCEDSDLSLRIRQMGFKISKVNMNFTHLGARTSTGLIQNDIKGFSIKNHYFLRKVWSNYFKNKSFNESITIKRDAAIGDTFFIEPILSELKNKNKFLDIHVHSKTPQLLEDNPYIKSINKPLQSNTKIIDLNSVYERKPKLHILDAYCEEFGIKNIINRVPRLYFNKKDNFINQEIKEICKKNKYVVIHNDNSWPGRSLPDETINELILLLKKIGFKVFIIGKVKKIFKNFDKLFLNENIYTIAYIIRHSDGFLGIDSMPMHIAIAYDKPGSIVFGCINPKYRIANLELMRPVINKELGCIFCHHWRTSPRYASDCLRGKPICMYSIKAIDIFNEFKKSREVWMASLETSKIREKVLKFCNGKGIDIGCRDDKIKSDSIGFDKIHYKGVDIIGDASQKIDFPNNHFDYVYSSHCLEDIPNTRQTLTEWLRILKPQCYIILHIPHKDLYKGYNADHCQMFNIEDIEKLLKELNCDIIESYIDNGENRYSFVVIGKKK